ncbi:nitrous oxide reductase family maturation protein NosD [Halorubellus litoreus]|uniref:Nitrous oxide reductase family maturation protein NosD n=1 Tax=Halorubellus litoreus TaxID=755308 RepID=A0ABD5VJ56_9EURY
MPSWSIAARVPPVDVLVERGFAVAAVVAVAALVVVGAVAPAVTGASGAPQMATGGVEDRAASHPPLAYDAPVEERDVDFDPPTRDGEVRVDGERFETLAAALDAATPGATVVVDGVVEGNVTVTTPNVTIRSADGGWGVVDGHGSGDVLTIEADDVTVSRLWVRNSGRDAAGNDAGVWIAGDDVVVRDSRVTETTFGVWVDGTSGAVVANTTIVGRDQVADRAERGNGIQLWRAEDARVRDNRITDARDGIYYSWASDVVATGNALWDLRYGVHYMYSDDCVLRENAAFGNDVGYALMVSEDLVIANNTAVNNTGRSGHGLMVKSIDDSTITGNHLVGNDRGLFVYNSLHNELAYNLVLANDVGVHLSAGSTDERVHHNSFVDNRDPVLADVGEHVVWNESAGNYWADATVRDVDDDGVSEVRHRPEGLVDSLAREHPLVAVFARSPAVGVLELAESQVPLVRSPGVVDERPLATPVHDWRRYYDRD